jgi:hypothetical protein
MQPVREVITTAAAANRMAATPKRERGERVVEGIENLTSDGGSQTNKATFRERGPILSLAGFQLLKKEVETFERRG